MDEEGFQTLGEPPACPTATTGSRTHPRLHAVASGTVAALNHVTTGICWSKLWDGRTWEIRVAGIATVIDPHSTVLLSLHWKNVHGCLAFSPYAAETLLAPHCGAFAWGDLADDLALALLQDAVDHLTGEHDEHAGSSIHIEGWASKEEAAALPFAIEVQIASGKAVVPLSCYFLTDLHGLQKCALLCKLLQAAPSISAWSMLPIPVTLELGWMDLPLAQLCGLQPQDVLLPDAWWSAASRKSICIRISHRLGIAADVMDGHELQSTSKVKTMEQEPLPHAKADADDGSKNIAPVQPEPTDLMEIPVRITFDLGERTLALAELAAVAPGHIFDLGLTPERAVNVRINGVRIGEGELVDIDGRIGVAVARITPLRT